MLLTQFDQCIFLGTMLSIGKINFPATQRRLRVTRFIATNELSFAGNHFSFDSPS